MLQYSMNIFKLIQVIPNENVLKFFEMIIYLNDTDKLRDDAFHLPLHSTLFTKY